MATDAHPIPVRLNLAIAFTQVVALLGLLWSAGQVSGWQIALVSLAYGLFMNSAYATMHEAEHGMLHPHRIINDGIGSLLALFFPAPFHLIRQGHIGHHMRNRSDDEAFDFYFEGESPLWKRLQLYGILTGFFWLVIMLSNFIAVLFPRVLQPKGIEFDRPTAALLESLNPKFLPLVRLESLAAIVLHAGLIWLWQIPAWHWFITLAGFGFLWSAMQYVHHFGTERDVMKGALNLRTWRWLDALWLHHNWHRRHHEHPTIPWLYLPHLNEGPEESRNLLLPAYARMWRGPAFTNEHVENRYAGKIIH